MSSVDLKTSKFFFPQVLFADVPEGQFNDQKVCLFFWLESDPGFLESPEKYFRLLQMLN